MTTGKRLSASGAAATAMLLLSACSSAPPQRPAMPEWPALPGATPPDGGVLGTLGDLGSKALEAVGLKKPDPPDPATLADAALPDWPVKWKVYASDSLNVTPDGKPLAVVARVYKLKNAEAFLRAPREVFGDAAKEKEVLGEDLMGVREVQLVPGQRHESTDKVSREARYVGIVTLFHRPADGRWRYAFGTPSAAWSGLHLGVHACAMSVQVGEPVGLPVNSARQTALPCP